MQAVWVVIKLLKLIWHQLNWFSLIQPAQPWLNHLAGRSTNGYKCIDATHSTHHHWHLSGSMPRAHLSDSSCPENFTVKPGNGWTVIFPLVPSNCRHFAFERFACSTNAHTAIRTRQFVFVSPFAIRKLGNLLDALQIGIEIDCSTNFRGSNPDSVRLVFFWCVIDFVISYVIFCVCVRVFSSLYGHNRRDTAQQGPESKCVS